MDGVLVDLIGYINQNYLPEYIKDVGYGEIIDNDPRCFLDSKPIKGAIEAFNKLSLRYDVYILSTAPWENIGAWSAKREWVEKWIGKSAYKRLILTHNKNLLNGDYLIDDRLHNGAGGFNGKLIIFGGSYYKDWNVVLETLIEN